MDSRDRSRGKRGRARVNYRLPILKQGRRNVTAKNREEIVERFGIPFPFPHEGIRLKGLLVDDKVYLYDLAQYNFLRFERGFFGEYHRVMPHDSDRPPIHNHYNSDRDEFPPPSSVFPIASLNLVESYFLNCICESLEIWDWKTSAKIPRQNLISRFTRLDDLFPYFFAAYFHFRQKKYTVKPGLKFGTDFVIYEYSPSRTHSLYAAYVLIPNLRDPGLAAIDAMQRANNTVKKDVLLVRVDATSLQGDDLKKPDCFTKMIITEVIVRRRETLTTFSTKMESEFTE